MTGDPEVDALVADRYLDALLAAVERHAADAPGRRRHGSRPARGRARPAAVARPRPPVVPVRGAAGVAPGGPRRGPGGAGARRRWWRHARSRSRGDAAPLDADPLLDAILGGELDPADADAVERASSGPGARRPLLVGGAALTSAAISLVGVAYVAWRASRPAPAARTGRWPRGPHRAGPGGRVRRRHDRGRDHGRRRRRIGRRVRARRGRDPGRARSDADEVPPVPVAPRGADRREDVDPLSLVRGAAVQQAAREGDARLPVLRASLPPPGPRAPRPAARRGARGRSTTRVSCPWTRWASWTRRRTRTA